MTAETKTACLWRIAILGGAAFAYFVVFPEDVHAVTAPLGNLLEFVGRILELTGSISPWLYGVVAVGLVCWTAVCLWGKKAEAPPPAGN